MWVYKGQGMVLKGERRRIEKFLIEEVFEIIQVDEIGYKSFRVLLTCALASLCI